MRKLTQEEFETKFYKLYSSDFDVVGTYINAITPVDIKCKQCGYIFAQTPNHYDKGHTTCPCCNPKGNTSPVIVGKNDMWTTHPDFACLLLNSDDGYKYRFNTDKVLDFKCPTCGKIKQIVPRYMSSVFTCKYCSNTISYPNRLMANLLDLLDVQFQTEYHIDGYLYRYDFMFIANNKKYIVEMDGGYGHGNIDTPNLTINEQIEIDRKKDLLAQQHGFVIIRIDSDYKKLNTRNEFLSMNIMNSELSNIFSITTELLEQAHALSEMSMMKKFSDLWNNGIKSYDEFSNYFYVTRPTIREYAKTCINLGLINISYSEFLDTIRLASNRKLAHTKGHAVICEQTNQVFYSVAEAQRQMNITNLSIHLSGKRAYCGILPDGTKLTWHKILNTNDYAA